MPGFNFDKNRRRQDDSNSRSQTTTYNRPRTTEEFQNANGKEYKYVPELKLEPLYTIFKGTLTDVNTFTQFGHTLVVGFNDVEILHGALFEKSTANDKDPEAKRKFKLFNFDTMVDDYYGSQAHNEERERQGLDPVEPQDPDEMTLEEILLGNERETYKPEYFGKVHPHYLIGARRLSGDDPLGEPNQFLYEDDGSFEIPGAEVYVNAGADSGPRFQQRQWVKTLCGEHFLTPDEVPDEDGSRNRNWFDADNISLHPSLEDREVIVMGYERTFETDDGDMVTYDHLDIIGADVPLDEATQEDLYALGWLSEEDWNSDYPGESNDGLIAGEPVSAPLEYSIDKFAEHGVTDKESVRVALMDGDGEGMEGVEGTFDYRNEAAWRLDEIVAEIRNRQ